MLAVSIITLTIILSNSVNPIVQSNINFKNMKDFEKLEEIKYWIENNNNDEWSQFQAFNLNGHTYMYYGLKSVSNYRMEFKDITMNDKSEVVVTILAGASRPPGSIQDMGGGPMNALIRLNKSLDSNVTIHMRMKDTQSPKISLEDETFNIIDLNK